MITHNRLIYIYIMYYISKQLETSTVLSNMLFQFKILNCLIPNGQNSVMLDSFGSTKHFKLDTLEQNIETFWNFL